MASLPENLWPKIERQPVAKETPDQTTVDLIHAGAFDRAYPQVAVYRCETSLTPTSSATDSHEICIQQTRGKGFPITLATEQ